MQLVKPHIATGERLTLRLTSWGRLGEAMASHEGWDVFVFGGIPGELVFAEVLRTRRKYVAARVVEVLESSPHRVEPPCPYYGDCTGCQWQHLDYAAQLTAKREKVVDALQRVGHLDDPPVSEVLASVQQYGYRNHARFTVSRGGALGFVNRETRQFVSVDYCRIMHDEVNRRLAQLQGNCGETTQLSIRAGKETGDFLVQPSLFGAGIPISTGQKTYVDSVGGQNFRVSSPSFFQVNIEQAAQTVQVVRRLLGLTLDDVVVDAYTGVGTFAILLAAYVKRVIAVEESSAAVADARENASGLGNVEFKIGKTEDVLGQLEEKPGVVILDPPRAGCQREALEHLVRLAPQRVAYVSCDADTLARDLRVLCQGGYTLQQVVPLDMFPQTHHVECVASLEYHTGEYQNRAQQVILASASPRRRELLSQLGLSFQVAPADIGEEALPGESPQEMVVRLSLAKAQAVAVQQEAGYVIGADSMVILGGRPMGKPADQDDARRMLRELRGTTHQVTTGVSIIEVASGRCLSTDMTSQVTLRELTDEEIEVSIASGTPLDKAGAYAVQDTVLRPAQSWQGCYSNIVGLPVCRVMDMLRELGCELPDQGEVARIEVCGPTCPNREDKQP